MFIMFFAGAKLINFQQNFFLVALVFAIEAAIVRFLLPDPYLYILGHN